MDLLINKIKAYLEKTFRNDPSRLKHIYSVEKMALRLGKIYQVDLNKLRISALLHDVAKNEDVDSMTLKLTEHFPTLELSNVPQGCLHAYIGAILAKEVFLIDDFDIINAIVYHCSGRAGMSSIEQIIYVSDYIEEHRAFVDNDLRTIAYQDINKATAMITDETIQYLKSHHRPVSFLTIDASNYYKKWR